ncbi:MAG: class I SAM-dependent methyltransferase [Actinobacteria bacterium]|nr:class I SAM-dependent methyltransferase [Actinomycetota bacterium]
MTALRAIRNQLDTIGVRGMVSLALRHRRGRPVGIWPTVEAALAGKRGLEIGGPSAVFRQRDLVPVYGVLAGLDNCQFASDTMWHGSQSDRSPFHWSHGKPPGTHFVLDGTELAPIADGAYDVVLSSHALEHIANPLRALAEWARVVGPEGHVLLVVPHAETTIDRHRSVTTLEHLVDDLRRGTTEDDLTHLDEFVALADWWLEPTGTTRDDFVRRQAQFVAERAIHHHVFDTRLLVRLLDRAGFGLVAVEAALPFHAIALARVSGAGGNGAFLEPDAEWSRRSCFRRDRVAT